VIPNASAAEVIMSSFRYSYLWELTTKVKLRINMRAMLCASEIEQKAQEEFSAFLLSIGSSNTSIFQVPEDLLLPRDSNLLEEIYGNFYVDRSSKFLTERSILCPLNRHVHMINDIAVSVFPGICQKFTSADSVKQDAGQNLSDELFPIEVLNTIDVPGLSRHELTLKVGVIVILLRNLSQKKGLLNGTRLQITSLNHRHFICARICTGTYVGQEVLLPQIDLTSNPSYLPFVITRRQFPIDLAFAMTINKSQGQTFQKVGVYLPSPCFEHGQLYVATSQVGKRSGLRIQILHGELVKGRSDITKNIVYQELVKE
jgi:hypothetical protein